MTDPDLPRRELVQLPPPPGAYDDVLARARRRRTRHAASAGGALLLSTVAVAGAVLLLPGSGGAEDRLLNRPTPAPSVSPSPRPTPVISPSPLATPTQSPAGDVATTPPTTLVPSAAAPTPTAAASVDPAETYNVQAPSGNITCSLSSLSAICEIGSWTYEPPPRPADCDLDWGYMAEVRVGTVAEMLCASDTGHLPDHPVLGYGQTVTNGVFTCRSTESAMTCYEVNGKHGIELSRTEFRLY